MNDSDKVLNNDSKIKFICAPQSCITVTFILYNRRPQQLISLHFSAKYTVCLALFFPQAVKIILSHGYFDVLRTAVSF